MAVERDERQERERSKAVDLAVGQIEKQFGKGSIMRLGQKGAIQPMDFIPTGAISIDYALGIGGVPRGRVIEIFGPESSGKTTLALQVIAEAQKLGGMAAFVDAEHALDAALRPEARRGHRQPAGVAAGQRRAGARNRRSPDPLERRRCRGRGLGGGPRSEGRNRRRDGRCADGSAGAADVAGAPQADRRGVEVENLASSSSTSSARRSASCSGTPKPPPAAAR